MKIIHYYSNENGSAVPDGCVMTLFDQMEDEGTAEIVFEDGTIRTREDFLDAMKTSCRLHIILDDDDEPAAVVWLNGHEGKMARIHFCVFKKSWGRHSARVGRFALAEILNLRFDNEPLYDCFVGYVPTKNRAARLFFRKLGVKTIGELPMGHWNARKNRSEPCTVVYIDRGCI